MYGNNPWALAAGLEDDSSIVDQVQVNISENHDEDGVPLEYNDMETGEAISEPIEAQAAEAELEVEEAEDVVEKLQDTAEDLESHLVGIESRINSEQGLTANEVSTMLVGLNRTFPNIGAIHPGTESFNHSRLAASNEVKDRIMRGLTELWKKIKAAIERIRVKMTQWFAKLLSKAARTKSKVQGIKKKAGTTKGSPQDTSIEIQGIASDLVDTRGKVPNNGSQVKEQLDELTKVVNWIYGPVSASSKALARKAKTSFKDMVTHLDKEAGTSTSTSSTAESAKLVMSMVDSSEINRAATSGPASNYQVSSDVRFKGLGKVAYVEVPGNKAVFFRTGIANVASLGQNDSDAITKHFNNIGPMLDKYDNIGEKAVDSKMDFSVIQSAMVGSICDGALIILDKIIQFNSAWRDVVSFNKELQNEIDKAVSNAEKSKNLKDNAKFSVIASQLIRGTGAMMQKDTKFYPIFTSYVVKVINAYMLWCTRSLANHKLD